MKVLLFKYSVPLVYFLSAVVLVLLIATSLLYVRVTKAQNDNRVLILQNDSIISEHIRLKNLSSDNVRSIDKKQPLTSVSLQQ